MERSTSHLHLAQLRSAAEGLSIANGETSWFGQHVPGSRHGAAAAGSKVTAGVLYNCLYTVPKPITFGEHAARLATPADASLARALQSANPGTGRRQGGWIYTGDLPDGESIVATKGGLSVAVPVAVLPSKSRPLTVGETVEVMMPAGSSARSPGYYVAHSVCELDYLRPLARLYLNVSPTGAPPLMNRLCTALNEAGLAFDLKAADDPTQYYRCDSMVLYVPRKVFALVLSLVHRVIDGLTGLIRPPVPAFVYRVRPGLGAADDPANGESFGMDRCRTIANAIAEVRAGADPSERLDAILAAFSRAGMDPRRPYLGAGLVDIYGG